jgi:hypothetical protein
MLKKTVVVPAPEMKTIKNYSLQGLTLILRSGGDFESIWLAPKQSITVLESRITQQVKNLHKRRLVSIGN